MLPFDGGIRAAFGGNHAHIVCALDVPVNAVIKWCISFYVFLNAPAFIVS